MTPRLCERCRLRWRTDGTRFCRTCQPMMGFALLRKPVRNASRPTPTRFAEYPPFVPHAVQIGREVFEVVWDGSVR